MAKRGRPRKEKIEAQPKIPNKCGLSDRTIEFCEWMAKGKKQVDAYQLVYPKANYSTACTNACKLMKQEAVQNKIADIKSKLAFRMEWSKEKSESTVCEILGQCMEKGDHKTALMAVQELNKMAGLYAPQKQITAKVDLSHTDINEIMDNLGYRKIEALPETQEIEAEVIDIE